MRFLRISLPVLGLACGTACCPRGFSIHREPIDGHTIDQALASDHPCERACSGALSGRSIERLDACSYGLDPDDVPRESGDTGLDLGRPGGWVTCSGRLEPYCR